MAAPAAVADEPAAGMCHCGGLLSDPKHRRVAYIAGALVGDNSSPGAHNRQTVLTNEEHDTLTSHLQWALSHFTPPSPGLGEFLVRGDPDARPLPPEFADHPNDIARIVWNTVMPLLNRLASVSPMRTDLLIRLLEPFDVASVLTPGRIRTTAKVDDGVAYAMMNGLARIGRPLRTLKTEFGDLLVDMVCRRIWAPATPDDAKRTTADGVRRLMPCAGHEALTDALSIVTRECKHVKSDCARELLKEFHFDGTRLVLPVNTPAFVSGHFHLYAQHPLVVDIEALKSAAVYSYRSITAAVKLILFTKPVDLPVVLWPILLAYMYHDCILQYSGELAV